MDTLLHRVGNFAPAPLQCAFPSIRTHYKLTGSKNSPLHMHCIIRGPSKLQAQGKGFGVPVPIKNASSQEEEEDNMTNKNNEDDEDEIPQVVFNRMIRRILLAVGTPMASGIGLLYLLSFIKKGQLWEVPGWLPLITILISFGTSALGIAYGTLSTSWDPETEGSIFGWEQAQKNWPELWKDEE